MKLNLFDSSSQFFFKTPHRTLKFEEKLLPLQTNDVQAMLLQSERVLELETYIAKMFTLIPTMGEPHGYR